jgi:hypothetical protein
MKREKTKINLSADDRKKLNKFVSKGIHAARNITRARIILALDSADGRVPSSITDLAASLAVSRQTVANVTKKFLTSGIESIIERKKRSIGPNKAKVTGEVEAFVIAMACSQPPEGYVRWTLSPLFAYGSTDNSGFTFSYNHPKNPQVK